MGFSESEHATEPLCIEGRCVRRAALHGAAFRRQVSWQGGFTFLELLVAVSIFALLSILAFRGLSAVLQADAALSQAGEQLAQIQFAMQLIERDVRQALPRPIRNERGEVEAALEGNQTRVMFTRAGWVNPLKIVRADLERIAFQLEGTTLQRLSWPVLDRTPRVQPRVQDLLRPITKMTVRYLDDNGDWHTTWPPLRQAEGSEAWPKALQIELQTALGLIRKVVGLVDTAQPIAVVGGTRG